MGEVGPCTLLLAKRACPSRRYVGLACAVPAENVSNFDACQDGHKNQQRQAQAFRWGWWRVETLLLVTTSALCSASTPCKPPIGPPRPAHACGALAHSICFKLVSNIQPLRVETDKQACCAVRCVSAPRLADRSAPPRSAQACGALHIGHSTTTTTITTSLTTTPLLCTTTRHAPQPIKSGQ